MYANNVECPLVAKRMIQLCRKFAYTARAQRGISASVFNCDKQVYHSLLQDDILPAADNKGRELLGVNAVSGFTVYPPKNQPQYLNASSSITAHHIKSYQVIWIKDTIKKFKIVRKLYNPKPPADPALSQPVPGCHTVKCLRIQVNRK